MPLTKIECDRAICPNGKPHARLADGLGMYLEVTAAGGKYWRMKYRHAGKEKRLALGVYPKVTLAEARKRRDKAREALSTGEDPAQLKREAKLKQALMDATTFEGVARQWWAHWSGPRSPRHAAYVIRRLEADVFPALGARPAAGITAPQLLAMAKGIESRGALDIAKRSLQTCGQIMRYAVAHGLIERNPAADVRPSDALKPRKKENYARLDAKDVPELLRKIEAYQGSAYPVFGANGVIGRYTAYNHEEAEVLVTCRGATCGAINISEPRSWVTGNAMVVRPLDGRLDKSFLEHLLRNGVDLSPAITGAAQPQITRTNLAPLMISFPNSVDEQQSLNAAFDELQSASDSLRDVYCRKLAALDELKKSLLHQAFTGALTEKYADEQVAEVA